MYIASLCKRKLVTIDHRATLAQAAQRLREEHVGLLVVTQATDEGPQAQGVVSDRDLAIEVLARGLDGARIEVGRLVTDRLVACADSADLDEAIELMRANGVRRLLVRNAQSQLVGLVALDDLIEACAAQLSALARVVGAGVERETTERAALAAAAQPPVRIPAVGTAGWQMR
jgi:CBS domain-containing protein